MSAAVRLRSTASEAVGGLPRQFWWLWTSTLVNRLGGFVVTFLALYLTGDRGFSPAYAGLVASLFGLGSAIAAVGGGVLADRWGRRPTLLAAQLGTAASTAVLGFCQDRVAIAVTAFLVGLASNASRPAVSAIIADVVPAEHRVRAYSLNYWAINIGFGVSAAVAGLIAAHGYLALFLIDAASTLACAVVVFVRVPETRPQSRPESRAGSRPLGTATADTACPAPAEPRTGLGAVFRDGRFMALVAVNLLLAVVAQQGSTTLAADMGLAGISAAQYGLVIGLNGVLIVLLQLPLTRVMEGRNRTGLLVASALLTGWGFGLTALAGGSAGFYAVTVAVWTIGEIMAAPTMMGLVAELSPARARGRYQGVYSLSWSLASFIGPAAGGYLLEHAGGRAVWGACAVFGTVAAGAFLLLGRRPVPDAAPTTAQDAASATAAGTVPAGPTATAANS
ncbi:MDR family MFS transporter [Kitasatospora sp. DSM 101779]|uniref:MDR family MFS transporter n=1 Tax=Kitasatospora sp. DSM 101779 TaxID=2853165 RepID=UPI0021DB5CAD|nr:MFS transporter [Kitasatospora sp. DSM 101779]MCU7824058.1 MFS transporter [Kitasatospora sp. DSM 101779]